MRTNLFRHPSLKAAMVARHVKSPSMCDFVHHRLAFVDAERDGRALSVDYTWRERTGCDAQLHAPRWRFEVNEVSLFEGHNFFICHWVLMRRSALLV